jgi:uncharacterized protein (TIGR03382 family)
MDCPAESLVETVTRWPGTGEPSFPTNGVVFSIYEGTATELANPGVAIIDGTGATVPSTTVEITGAGPHRHAFLTTPTAPLDPLTKYYLGDTINWNCTAEPCSVTFKKTTLFTTASGALTTTTPAPVASLASQMADSCTGSACACGTYHGLISTLANPATGAIRYDLFDNGQPIERNAPFEISTDCAQPGDVPYVALDTVPLAVGKHHLTWHGFDLAGHESAGTQALDLDLECPAVTTPPDANMGSGSGSGQGDDGGGCSAGGAGGLAPMFVAVGLIAVRRRSRGQRGQA